MSLAFTGAHRGGSGPPLVCLHGFTDTWRTWQLVLPALERRHDVLAPTLPGHAGGPSLPGELDEAAFADAVEAAMDEAGLETAHVVGNSLGGFLALELAARGRARSVVALAPAGGWNEGDDAYRELLGQFAAIQELARVAAPHVDALVAMPEMRRSATELVVERWEHIPEELVAHLIVGVARCVDVGPLVELALASEWTLDACAIECPVRIVWGTADRVLPWPSAAARFREALPRAEWVELEGAGHCPQLDVPLETAELILGLTAQ